MIWTSRFMHAHSTAMSQNISGLECLVTNERNFLFTYAFNRLASAAGNFLWTLRENLEVGEGSHA